MSYITDSFKKFLCMGLSDHHRKMCIPIRIRWENLQLKSSSSRYHRQYLTVKKREMYFCILENFEDIFQTA